MDKFHVINPYSEEDYNKIKAFEQKNGILTKSSEYIETSLSSKKEEEYLAEKKKNNEINESLVIEENGEIKEICYLQAEKDIKACRIYFPITKSRSKKLISIATKYAMETLEMQDVFIMVNEKDESLLKTIGTGEYENIGIDNGYVAFLAEDEYQINSVRVTK